MIRVDELKAIFARNDVSKSKVAKILGISPETFSRKLKKGVLNNNEIQKLIEIFDIKEPLEIFFASCVASNATNGDDIRNKTA